MVKDDCIFCKLANGVIPTNTVYEDDLFRVFMDASPATKGHCLIVPKNHYANLFELGEEETNKLLALAKKVATHLKDKLGADGINLVQNNGEIAGQTVFHFHLHVIPRFEGDGQKIGWKPGQPSEEEIANILEQIKM